MNLDQLLVEIVSAWKAYLTTSDAGSLSTNPQFLVGRYQGLRDAYTMLGGSWAALSSALDNA